MKLERTSLASMSPVCSPDAAAHLGAAALIREGQIEAPSSDADGLDEVRASERRAAQVAGASPASLERLMVVWLNQLRHTPPLPAPRDSDPLARPVTQRLPYTPHPLLYIKQSLPVHWRMLASQVDRLNRLHAEDDGSDPQQQVERLQRSWKRQLMQPERPSPSATHLQGLAALAALDAGAQNWPPYALNEAAVDAAAVRGWTTRDALSGIWAAGRAFERSDSPACLRAALPEMSAYLGVLRSSLRNMKRERQGWQDLAVHVGAVLAEMPPQPPRPGKAYAVRDIFLAPRGQALITDAETYDGLKESYLRVQEMAGRLHVETQAAVCIWSGALTRGRQRLEFLRRPLKRPPEAETGRMGSLARCKSATNLPSSCASVVS